MASVGLAFYWLAMFTGTHVPRIPVRMEGSGTDKWLHFGAYTGLAFLLSAVLSLRQDVNGSRTGLVQSRLRRSITVVLVCWTYGVLDEWLQGFVGRDPDVYDWCADALGAVMGVGLFGVSVKPFKISRRSIEKKSPPSTTWKTHRRE